MPGHKVFEDIEWKAKPSKGKGRSGGKLIITEQRELDINDAEGINDYKKQLQKRKAQIVNQVKQLKAEAEKINLILAKLDPNNSIEETDEKAGL
ncbi:MAG: hypothetical protein FH756_05865 [Firmicutes bacterium]|nr:hypothetical protein [Bacillota bacterium]